MSSINPNSNPLKILYTEAATTYGGQERYIHRLMLAMRDQGHTVEALCQANSELNTRLQTDGFTVHHAVLERGFWRFLRNTFGLRGLLKKQQYDVVNTHSRCDTVHVGFAAKLAGVPLVVRTRHLAKPIGSLLSYTWAAHRVIAVSEFVRQQIIHRGVNPDYVDIVFPAVNLPDPLPPQQLRHELGLDEEATVVGTVAVLRKEKGVQELIQAMAPLLRAQADGSLHLVIVGGGTLLPQLQHFAEQLEVSEQVHFLGTRNDISSLLGDFDVFASATYIEASGTTFAEAAAAKVAVVGTQVGGVPEMMNPGKSGLLVPLHDVVALRKALERLITNKALRHSMGQAGYEYAVAEGRFRLDTMQQRTEHSYRRWLNQRGRHV